MQTFYFPNEMAYSPNKPQANETTRDDVSTKKTRAKEVHSPLLTPWVNLSLSQLTINLIGMVINGYASSHQKQFKIHMSHWRGKIFSLDENKIYPTACYAFFKKWIKAYEKNNPEQSNDFFKFAQITFQQFSSSSNESKLFEVFYLILLHTPVIDKKTDIQVHRLFLKAKESQKNGKEQKVTSTHTSQTVPSSQVTVSSFHSQTFFSSNTAPIVL